MNMITQEISYHRKGHVAQYSFKFEKPYLLVIEIYFIVTTNLFFPIN